MKMSELIAAVGDDNIKFQNLNNDARDIDYTVRSGMKITFYTDGFSPGEIIGGDTSKTKNIGLVIWLPRDRVDAAIAQAKGSDQ